MECKVTNYFLLIQVKKQKYKLFLKLFANPIGFEFAKIVFLSYSSIYNPSKINLK